MRTPKRLLLTFTILAVISMIAACGNQTSLPAVQLPGFLDKSSSEVRDSYHFAAAHHTDLQTVPCYCGCEAMGHTSNWECYIQEIDADGNIIWDNHASICGICIDITQDVKRLKANGRTPAEIRTYIDDIYSKFGPGTNTPLPAA
jgi:hypothetical protein